MPPAFPPPPSRVIDVTVLLIGAGYASTSVGPMEVFHAAGTLWNRLNRVAAEPRFRVRSASLNGRVVDSTCRLGLLPSCAIGDIDATDIIIVPAAGPDLAACLADAAPLLPWLRHWHARGAYIAGICTGVALLAECGLLDGRRATTHWAHADALRQRYPSVHWQPEHFLTEDGHVFCGGGVHAAMDLSLFLVERFCGHQVARQCARALLLNMPRSSQTSYAAMPLARPHADPLIQRSEQLLRRSLRQEHSIEQLASQVELGPRSFMRRFKAATGYTPGAYLQLLRMARARQMLEDGDASIAAIAAAVGYADLTFFRRLFRRHTGLTPSVYRQQFGPQHAAT
ncbi:helix-turn-helix domain-containing protein [Pseudoduganella sp. FT25W]|uniref:Helix-turn-helix domain-containing protein n=2 Tax=Duganella alba TaxID=2666081 RepID=A0A6L5QPJ4_9BURK|nr:helix-turn-helix domain-containing protein [Duganella alba]MRX20230.1 helix-turn-helix domain-containing protein [Duganella alba]